jgi:hypothetical protein
MLDCATVGMLLEVGILAANHRCTSCYIDTFLLLDSCTDGEKIAYVAAILRWKFNGAH